jgi:uncharacterized protein (TIGR02246 family)
MTNYGRTLGIVFGGVCVKHRSEMTLEERVAVQEAIQDIRRLFFQYNWALDHGDVAGIAHNFTEDGVFQFDGAKWEGRDKVSAYFTEDFKKHTAMLHYPINIIVDVKELDPNPEGSGVAEAWATLWDLFNMEYKREESGAFLTGYYNMKASREKGEWKIKRLKVIIKWVVPTQEWGLMEGFEVRPELRGKHDEQ